ncbi:MAG: protein-disulfide reductase DsbD family protein [Lacibacter sp.]
MKKIVLFFLLLLACFLANAQVQNPVKWSYKLKKISNTKYEVHITATIGHGWHIYSQTTPDGGPVPTAIKFSKNPLIILVGAAKEMGKLEQLHEELFGVDVKQFSNTVNFIQTVKIKASVKTAVTGTIEFMVCNDRECLPPSTIKFTLPLQ